MIKYILDLSEYEVTYPVREDGKQVEKTDVYPLRDNLSNYLRAVGLFDTGEEIAEAVVLAKQILACDTEDDTLVLDEREMKVLKKCINLHVKLTKENKSNLGGPIHEELILRVFTMKEKE